MVRLFCLSAFRCICVYLRPNLELANALSADCGFHHVACSCMRGSPCGLSFTDSPRVYSSSNPWKITAAFQSISSSRDEYVALVEKLKQNGPLDTKGADRRSKLEHGHIALTKALEDRLPVIDAELTVSRLWWRTRVDPSLDLHSVFMVIAGTHADTLSP